MAIILDLTVVLIVALTLFFVIRKGFVKSVLDFASVICALLFSKMFSPYVSNVIYSLLYEGVSEKINGIIGAMVNSNSLPDGFTQESVVSKLFSYDSDLAESLMKDALGNTVKVITDNLVGLLSYALAFILIFVLTIILFKVLSYLLGKLFELPVLRTLNKTLACVLGIVLSALYVMIFIAVMQVSIPPLSSVYPELISEEIVNNSYIFSYLYNFEWLKIFVN